MKTTPIGAMKVLQRFLPLHIISETETQTGIYRTICNQLWRHKSTNGRTGSTQTTMGLVWYTKGFKTNKGTGAVLCRWGSRRGHSFNLELHTMVLQAEAYDIKGCIM